MYEETKSIDWKGIFLKVIIVFLIILIAVKGYTLLKGKKETKKENIEIKDPITNKTSKIFLENLEKLEKAGKEYFEKNKNELPNKKEQTKVIILNTLIEKKLIEELKDDNGISCDSNLSTITATLENDKIQLKSNLICGSNNDFRLAYIEKIESKEETTKGNVIVSNTTTSTKEETNKKEETNNKKEETTKKPSSEVIVIKRPEEPKTTKPVKYYTVKFDKNGGTKSYAPQQIRENNVVAYPGKNEKNNCKFNGWFYEGELYDFGRKVTSDMVLVANYTCNTKLVTKTYSKYIYSVGWASKDVNSFKVNHTLRIPENLKDDNITEIKLKSLVPVGSINTLELINEYKNNHKNTFIYAPNGWEYNITNKNNLSTINPNSVTFEFDNKTTDVINAMAFGFDVTWKTNSIDSKCTTSFEVKTAKNLCGYGIYYRATWEYKIYE